MTNAVGRMLVGLLVLAVVLPAPPVRGQGSDPPPLQAQLFFKEPLPPDLVFAPGAPIIMILQVENSSADRVNTFAGFSESDMFRRLYFVEPGGGLVTNTSEGSIIRESRPIGFCQSRSGVILRPAAIPVVPLEELAGPPTPFVREFEFDARTLYDLSRPGRYTVDARIPLLTFQSGDPTGLITDCDQFPGVKVVNIGAATPGQQFLVRSNPLEFTVGGTAGGDTVPPELAAACAPPGSSPSITGLDPGGGIGSIVRTPGQGEETYTIFDLTGNRLQATFEVRPQQRQIEFAVRRLLYGASEVVVASNKVKCKWIQDRRSGALTFLSQEVTIKAAQQNVEATATFHLKVNQTQIVSRRSDGRGFDKVIRPGMVLLRVTTHQGQLGLEF